MMLDEIIEKCENIIQAAQQHEEPFITPPVTYSFAVIFLALAQEIKELKEK